MLQSEEEITPTDETIRSTRSHRQTNRNTAQAESSNDDDSEDDQALSRLVQNKSKTNSRM